MRPLALSLGAFSVFGHAQVPFERADQRVQIVRYEQVIAMPGGGWVVAGVEQGWGERRTLITGLGSDGQSLWESPANAPGAAFHPHVMSDLPGGFVVGGSPIECSLPTGLHVLQRRTWSGAVEWTITLPDGFAPASMDIASNSLIVLGDDAETSEPHVMVLNDAGDAIASWSALQDGLRVVRWAGDGGILALHGDLLAHHAPTGEAIASVVPGSPGLDLRVIAPDDIRVLHADRVVRYNEALAPMDSVALTGLSDARSMIRAEGLLWILCTEHIASLDPATGQLTSFGLASIAGHTVAGMAIQDGLVMTVGTASVEGRSAGVLRAFTTEGAVAQHDENVVLSIASVDSLYLEVAEAFPQIVRVHFQVTLRVENAGSVPVIKVLLNTQRTVGFCGADFGANAHPDALVIPPGGSADVQMPVISSMPFTVPVGDTLRFTPCFVALSPNDRVDRLPADNLTCMEAAFHNTTGMEEQRAPAGMVVAPMPFHDRFHVQLTDPRNRPTHLAVHDAHGRTLMHLAWPPGVTRYEVDGSSLPAGVLFLRLEGALARTALRVVRMP